MWAIFECRLGGGKKYICPVIDSDRGDAWNIVIILQSFLETIDALKHISVKDKTDLHIA